MIGSIEIKGKQRKFVFIKECQLEKLIFLEVHELNKKGIVPKVTYTESGIVITYEATESAKASPDPQQQPYDAPGEFEHI